MASSSPYEVEVTVTSAKDTKNVNWRNGPNRPYAVVWVDPANKCSTRVDEEGDTCPVWDHTLTLPLPSPRVEDHTLYIDVVHANRPGEDTKPLIGSARLKLADVLDDAGFGERATRSIQLKRPSGRPQGKVNVTVAVREIGRYQSRDAYYPAPYGVPPAPQAGGSRDYNYPGYAAPYAAPGGGYYGAQAAPPSGYPYSAPPPPVQAGYGYAQPAPAPGGYGAAPGGGYGGYGAAPGGGYGGYGAGPAPVVEEKKKSKFGGMGAGLAVGAVAGALGGVALVEGFDALEDKVADDAAEKVEDDLYDDDDGGDF